MSKHYTLYRADSRIAIVDNASHVVALLTAKESDRFSSMYEMLNHLKGNGCESFFDDKMEELCGVFLERAA